MATEPQVFDLLVFLIRNRHRFVTKDELLAEVWGGRIVSDATLATRIAAARSAVGDTGRQQCCIRTLSRRGLRFVADVVEVPQAANGVNAGTSALPHDAAAETGLSDCRARLAILPFSVLSDSFQTACFARGVFEEVLAAFSRVSRIQICTLSARVHAHSRASDAPPEDCALEADYVLTGSVMCSSDVIRLLCKLLAPDGSVLWAERFEGSIGETFDLQDEFTLQVLTAVVPRLEAVEIARARRKKPDALTTYDLYLRALGSVRLMTRAGNDAALDLLARALEIDPNYGLAAGLAAWARTLRVAQNWAEDEHFEEACGLELGRIAIASGHDDAEALATGGYALAALGGEFREGLSAIEQAIRLQPNSSTVLAHAGWVYNYLGRYEQAVHHLERAVLLGQSDPVLFRARTALAYAYVLKGDFEAAAEAAGKAIAANAGYTVAYRAYASALANGGQIDKARAVIERLSKLTPELSASKLAEATVFRNSGGLDRILSGLRAAGVPK